MTPADNALWLIAQTVALLVACFGFTWLCDQLRIAQQRWAFDSMLMRTRMHRRKSDPPVPSSIAAQMVERCGLCANPRELTASVLSRAHRPDIGARVWEDTHVGICAECASIVYQQERAA